MQKNVWIFTQPIKYEFGSGSAAEWIQVRSDQVITDKGLKQNFCLQVFLDTEIMMRNCGPLSVLGSI